MKKAEFLKELEKRLNGLPKSDIDERVSFYSEMIDDRVEDGKTEEEAIDDLGGIDTVVNQIAAETPMLNLVKERIKPKRGLRGFEIAMLIAGFPLWFPLLLVFFVLVFVFFILLWVLVIVTYSAEIGLIGLGALATIKSVFDFMNGSLNIGYLGIALLAAGLSILFIFVCVAATKLSAKITKGVIVGIKRSLIGGKKNA